MFRAAFLDTRCHTPRSARYTGRSQICDFIKLPVPGPPCTSRRTLNSLNSRRWNDDWWVKEKTAIAAECTIRPPGALWRPGTSASSRHHRAYSRHRWKKIRGRSFHRATAWTTTTTSQTTRFCATFAITLPCWNVFPVRLLATIPWAGSQTTPRCHLLERISEITRRDTLDGGASRPVQKRAMPGG